MSTAETAIAEIPGRPRLRTAVTIERKAAAVANASWPSTRGAKVSRISAAVAVSAYV